MRKFKWYWLAPLLIVLVLLTGCKQQPAEHRGQQLNVVTSLKVYQEAASAVLGKYGHASAIISSPDIDPHDFEANTKTARQIADADIVIANGLGYDDWLNKLTTAANDDSKFVSVASDVLHKPAGANEHVFYDPTMMPKLSHYLARRFGKLQPQHAAYFDKQAANYIKSLQPLYDEINRLKNRGRGEYAASSEPVFDYALQAAGFKLTATHFAKAIEDGTDPSPQDLAELQGQIKSGKLAVFVVNVQEESGLVSTVEKQAQRADVKIVRVRETQPAGKNYMQWMLSNYQQMDIK